MSTWICLLFILMNSHWQHTHIQNSILLKRKNHSEKNVLRRLATRSWFSVLLYNETEQTFKRNYFASEKLFSFQFLGKGYMMLSSFKLPHWHTHHIYEYVQMHNYRKMSLCKHVLYIGWETERACKGRLGKCVHVCTRRERCWGNTYHITKKLKGAIWDFLLNSLLITFQTV